MEDKHMPLVPHHKHHHGHHYRYHGHYRHFHPYHDPNSTAWNGGHEWIHWIGDKRHFRPWYDPNSDYNTNAKSYYDYLGYRIRLFDAVIDQTNELLRRDITFEDSSTIDFTKENDWQERDDVLNIKADVKVSQDELNDIEVREDGLWSEDFQPKIDDLQNQINDNRKRIEDLEAVVYNRAEWKEVPVGTGLDIVYFNNTHNSHDPSLGDTRLWYAKVNNNIMLHIRFNWCSDNLSEICLSNQVLNPFVSRPQSLLVGVKFKGEYAWLNNLQTRLTSSIENGALGVSPKSARASWKPDYQVVMSDGITNPKFTLVFSSYADGYGSRWTFRDNYSDNLYTEAGTNINWWASYQIED